MPTSYGQSEQVHGQSNVRLTIGEKRKEGVLNQGVVNLLEPKVGTKGFSVLCQGEDRVVSRYNAMTRRPSWPVGLAEATFSGI
jgi:hypothetical protein